MTATPTTLITFVLDETGSMQPIKDDTPHTLRYGRSLRALRHTNEGLKRGPKD